MNRPPEPTDMAIAGSPRLQALLGEVVPAWHDPDMPVLTCTKSDVFHDGAAPATHLLAYATADQGWCVRPRCDKHRAEWDAALLRKVFPATECLKVQLVKPDELAERRHDLLMEIGELWRGDWSGHDFDGKDGQTWIDTALHGDSDALGKLSAELQDIRDSY